MLYSHVDKELQSSLSLLALKELILLRVSSLFLLRVYIMSLVKARYPAVFFFFKRQEATVY
jgi:hypothetical protein